VSKASAAALRSIARDASRMRLGERSTKERPADLTIIFGASGPGDGEAPEMAPDVDEDDDE
jgi:hypothetical protein